MSVAIAAAVAAATAATFSPPPVEDEKDAILSLLGLQATRTATPASRPSDKETDESPLKKIKMEAAQIGNNIDDAAGSDEDDGVRLDESPVPRPSLSDEDEDDEAAEKHPSSFSRPQAITPTPALKRKAKRMRAASADAAAAASHHINMGVRLRKVGKKRKHHATTDGQFEDAQESFFASFPAFFGSGAAAAAAAPGDGEIPPPPHLIQQVSNEYPTPPSTTLQAQTSAEVQRRLLAFQQQKMFEAWSQSPQFAQFSAMMAAMPLPPGAAAGNKDLLMQQAMMFQAHTQQAMARQQQQQQQTPNSAAAASAARAAPSSSGAPGAATAIPSHLAALRGAWGSVHGHAATTTATTKSDTAKIAEPPSSPVPDEDIVIPPSERHKFAMIPPTKDAKSVKMVRTEPQPQAPLRPADSDAEEAYKEDITPFSTKKNKNKSKNKTKTVSPPSLGAGGDTDGTPPHTNKTMSTKMRFEQYAPPTTWGKLAKVPKMAPVYADVSCELPMKVILEHDVLLGRGGLTNTNPGNIRFRNLIRKYRIHYCTAPKGDKGALSRYICNYVRSMGGRFLAKDPKNQKAEAYYEVGDEKAMAKCGQALREGTAEFNRRERDRTEQAEQGGAMIVVTALEGMKTTARENAAE